MGKVDDYRKTLIKLSDWDSYLLEESCLPGPRANLELAEAAGGGAMGAIGGYAILRFRSPLEIKGRRSHGSAEAG